MFALTFFVACKAQPQIFLDRIITQDETWVYNFDPETKRQSMVWKHASSPTPKKLIVIPSAGKVMATVFGTIIGVIMIDYLSKGSTVTDAYYANELRKLLEALKSKH